MTITPTWIGVFFGAQNTSTLRAYVNIVRSCEKKDFKYQKHNIGLGKIIQ